MVKIIMTNPEEQVSEILKMGFSLLFFFLYIRLILYLAKQVSGSEKMNTDSNQTNKDEQQMKRSCVDCHTTRTPLWRGGPAGPRVNNH